MTEQLTWSSFFSLCVFMVVMVYVALFLVIETEDYFRPQISREMYCQKTSDQEVWKCIPK